VTLILSLNRFKKLAALAFLFQAIPLLAQVPVALTPDPWVQFTDKNGTPLAGGKLCTFNAGTTTPAATYVDINGIIQNTNPIVLDAGGFATIYLASQAYKMILYDGSGNSSCPNSGVQQRSQDNVNAFQPVTGALSVTFAGVTSDPTGVAGLMNYRTDLPCFRSFTTVWDCFVRLADTQTLTNKTLTAPVLTNPAINGVTPNAVVPTSGQVYTATGANAAGFASRTIGFSFIIDGAGTVLTSGSKGYVEIPVACTISGWTILADQSGSVIVDVKRSTYAGFPTTVSIAGTEKPNLISQQNNNDFTLVNWGSKTLAQGDILEFVVASPVTITRVTVAFRMTIP